MTSPSNAVVLVIGMGRVGTGAYDALNDELQKKVYGIGLEERRVKSQCTTVRNVIMADAEDPDFWEHIDLIPIHLIMFALPNHRDVFEVSKQLRNTMMPIAQYHSSRSLFCLSVDLSKI